MPSVVPTMFQRLSKQLKYEHDNLENDTGSSESELSHIHLDTKEDWDKLRNSFIETTLLQFTSIPVKRSQKLFQ